MLKKIFIDALVTYLALGFGVVTTGAVMSRMGGTHDPFPEFAPLWINASLFLAFFVLYLYRLSRSTR